jgi:DNA-directed RNA polymerase specialized sigma24 family protein
LGKFGNTLSRAEQEDLFQDVFVILLDGGLQRFRGSTEYEFRAYLARIVRNEVYTWIRDRDRHGILAAGGEPAGCARTTPWYHARPEPDAKPCSRP